MTIVTSGKSVIPVCFQPESRKSKVSTTFGEVTGKQKKWLRVGLTVAV
jgi:hypothetical protein